ncbi:MAG: hypothetical protein DRH24_09520 [Deltaproteobacteria bacterium]|nr:MAG: hypothetical protein DRH24_09520 [Deltaproteobacteria bacterium]
MSNSCAKRFFLLNQSNLETSFLTLKCARYLDFKCLSDNHDKIYKFFETYELDWMGRFNARRLNIKKPGGKCIHAQISVHSFYRTGYMNSAYLLSVVGWKYGCKLDN